MLLPEQAAHTLDEQKLLSQSSAAAQVVAPVLPRQTLPAQQRPLAHWPFIVHACPSAARQAPLPLLPSHASGATQALLSVPPCGTVVQVPTWPATSQLWQVVVQALLQQTPSTQKVLTHSLPTAHAVLCA